MQAARTAALQPAQVIPRVCEWHKRSKDNAPTHRAVQPTGGCLEAMAHLVLFCPSLSVLKGSVGFPGTENDGILSLFSPIVQSSRVLFSLGFFFCFFFGEQSIL